MRKSHGILDSFLLPVNKYLALNFKKFNFYQISVFIYFVLPKKHNLDSSKKVVYISFQWNHNWLYDQIFDVLPI